MTRQSKYLQGKKYGKLTALKFHHKDQGNHYWLCLCDCGTEKVIRKTSLVNGQRPMCDNCRFVVLPKSRTEERQVYSIWCQMKTRCYNKNSRSFAIYGGKGIEVCDDWLESFERFIYAMGERPKGTHLCRVDTDADFSPENCIWSPRSEIPEIRRLLS